MAPDLVLGLIALGVTMLAQGGGLLIWGAGLSHRVKALEDDVRPLTALVAQIARLETRMDGLIDQVKDLNASIRWMREPTRHEAET